MCPTWPMLVSLTTTRKFYPDPAALQEKHKLDKGSVKKMYLQIYRCSHKVSACPSAVFVLHCGSSPGNRCLGNFLSYHFTAKNTAGLRNCLNYLTLYKCYSDLLYSAGLLEHGGCYDDYHFIVLSLWADLMSAFKPLRGSFNSQKLQKTGLGCFSQLCSLPRPQWKSSPTLGTFVGVLL